MYSKFEDKFAVLYKVNFSHIIYRFEALEVKNLTLQIVCKSELKQKRYDHLKIIM